MKILRTRIEFETVEPIQILDVTGQVRDWLKTTGIREGLLNVTSPHTTARVNVNEREPQLQKDMVTWLKRFVPRDGEWLHNLVAVDGPRQRSLPHPRASHERLREHCGCGRSDGPRRLAGHLFC